MVLPFVETFHTVDAGAVPRVSSSLSLRDKLGTLRARVGALRSNYKIPPGLYCVGTPDENAPVLVTGNYKLTFDVLRQELGQHDVWLLVIDSRGINVWCAAGKGTFSTDEISYQVKRVQLDKYVSHREIIIPQLGATGVAAHKLKKLCGFKGTFGPVRASDVPAFLNTGAADESMKSVTFTLGERAVLIPVEICLFWKSFLAILAGASVLSLIAPTFPSLAPYLERTFLAASYSTLGVVSGAAITPLLLPWIPAKQFWLKGAISGLVITLLSLLFVLPGQNVLASIALLMWSTALSSFMAMNFTGSTPFTSLTGVSKEMRRGVPLQLSAAVLGAILWPISTFF